MRLDLTHARGTYRMQWLDITASHWTAWRPCQAGRWIPLKSPGQGHWVALLERAP